jgi:HEAT repeat protein
VWFVRLQAIKTATGVAGEAAARPIGKLLFDTNWRVRSEAAQALTGLGDCAVDVFLVALMTKDTYAKESICEEIEKTHCMDQLIEALGNDSEAMRKKSWDILRIMHGLRFSTPLTEFLAGGGSERIKGEVRRLLQTEGA